MIDSHLHFTSLFGMILDHPLQFLEQNIALMCWLLDIYVGKQRVKLVESIKLDSSTYDVSQKRASVLCKYISQSS